MNTSYNLFWRFIMQTASYKNIYFVKELYSTSCQLCQFDESMAVRIYSVPLFAELFFHSYDAYLKEQMHLVRSFFAM